MPRNYARLSFTQPLRLTNPAGFSGPKTFIACVESPAAHWRDAMVERPDCKSKDGKSDVPGGLTQFNAAYAVGGPACTIKTVEKITDVRVDHFVVINFAGFKEMEGIIEQRSSR